MTPVVRALTKWPMCGVEDGHEVTVLCGMVNYVTGKIPDRYKDVKFHRSSYKKDLEVMRCYVSPEYNTNFIGRLWAYFSFVWYGIVAGLSKLKGRKYDVIIATSPPLFVGIVALVISTVKRIPYVFEVRDLWPESAIDTGVLKNKMIIRFSYWFEKLVYKKAFLINVLTPAFREKLIDKKGISPKKIIFIPNACDFSLSDSLLENFDVNTYRGQLGWSEEFVITYVGAHGVANHLMQLVEAAERLASQKVRFVLIGDGMQKKMLKEVVLSKDIKNITFLDSIPKREVMKYILASDVGASVLKRVDTFKTVYSNKTFDYMACQKPILMVIDGVSRELVEQAQCGVYAEPENIHEIVEKIELLRQDPAELKRMGSRGYSYAKEHFDRTVLAKRYIRELQNHLPDVR